MGLFDSIGPVIGAGADVANTAIAMDQLKYQKAAQKETWRREDNAVQRRARDLQAAGINPLLAAGGAAAASSPIQVGVPQVSFDNAQAMASLSRTGHDIARTDADKALALQSIKNAQETESQLKELTKGVALENESKRLRNSEQSWNLGLAKARGLRTSDTGVAQLAGSIFDALRNYMPGVSKITGPLLGAASDLAGAVGKGVSSAAKTIAQGGSFDLKPPPGYKALPNGNGWVKIKSEQVSGSRNRSR